MDFEIHPNRSKITWMAVGSVLFVVVSFLVAFDQDVNLFKRIGAGFGVVFFGACFYFFLAKLIDKRPSLSIGQAGILDNTSTLQVGLIAWEDIMALQILEISKQHLLAIEVRNPDKYLRAMNPLARRAASINQAQFGYAILFPQSVLATPLVEVIMHIEQRLGRTATRNPARVEPGAVQAVLELLL